MLDFKFFAQTSKSKLVQQFSDYVHLYSDFLQGVSQEQIITKGAFTQPRKHLISKFNQIAFPIFIAFYILSWYERLFKALKQEVANFKAIVMFVSKSAV